MWGYYLIKHATGMQIIRLTGEIIKLKQAHCLVCCKLMLIMLYLQHNLLYMQTYANHALLMT